MSRTDLQPERRYCLATNIDLCYFLMLFTAKTLPPRGFFSTQVEGDNKIHRYVRHRGINKMVVSTSIIFCNTISSYLGNELDEQFYS